MVPRTTFEATSGPPARIHRSTYVALAFSVLFVLLVTVPGQLVTSANVFATGKYGPHFGVSEHYEHGWPVKYLQRNCFLTSGRPYSKLSCWSLSRGVEQFLLGGLLLNIVVGLGSVAIGGCLFETWRRRRGKLLQIGLSELLLLVTIAGICFAVPVINRSRYREQLDILESIRQRKEQPWSLSHHADWEPGGPAFLRELLGDDRMRIFDRIVGIDVYGEDLAQAIRLPHIKVVRILGAVSNRELKLLQCFADLEALDMSFVGLSEDGDEVVDAEGYSVEQYFQLPALPKLRGLNLYSSAFHGEGLNNLDAIEVLDLSDTDVDDAALASLSRLTCLKDLSLAGTKVTNAGLQHLTSLNQLESLWLGFSAIDDEGLHNLALLPGLRHLDLYGARLSDAGLPYLKQFIQLKTLDIHASIISQNGRIELPKSLPSCRISF